MGHFKSAESATIAHGIVKPSKSFSIFTGIALVVGIFFLALKRFAKTEDQSPLFVVLAAAFLLSKPMAAYQMGEEYARSVGVNVRLFSAVLVLLSSLLAACVTAFAGPISFVGIAVPHLVKQLLGSAKPLHVLPGCCLGGAAFCLFCDLLARSLFAPTELSISSVTAVFGAPVVIWLLVRRSQEGAR